MTMLIKDDFPTPLQVNLGKEMTDEEFFTFCVANKHLRIERDEYKQIIIMPPSGSESGSQNSEVNYAVQHWNKQTGLGKVFESSAGFTLLDGSVRSPDVGWVTAEKWNAVSKEERKKFAALAPDFVVEVLSPTDSLKSTKEKMQKWIANGVRLGWLIAPEHKLVFIYRADGTVDKLEGFGKTLSGEDVLPGFVFDLSVLL